MLNHQMLDNVSHKDLRVITTRGAGYGDNIASTGVFPIEFRRVQAEYPIVFRQSGSSDHVEAVAMLGLAEGENLFLDGEHWRARYLPLTIERQPFLIGFQARSEGGVPVDEPVVHIDMNHPRVSQTEGEAVFLEHGGTSPYLERINSVLKAIHEGHSENRQFSGALLEHELLEPFTLEIELNDHSKFQLAGFQTINEDKLAALDANALGSLHAKGYLEHIYMALASIANFSVLIEKKNALLESAS